MIPNLATEPLRHLFHTFTNPIADDQQQKPPISETAVDRVNEGGLSGRVVVKITDMTEQGWRGLLCRLLTGLESRLKIGVGPSGHLLRIVDSLRHDFPPSLRILPELRLHERHIARWTEEEGIDTTTPWHRELRAQAHRRREHRIEVPHWKQRWFLGEQIPKI